MNGSNRHLVLDRSRPSTSQAPVVLYSDLPDLTETMRAALNRTRR